MIVRLLVVLCLIIFGAGFISFTACVIWLGLKAFFIKPAQIKPDVKPDHLNSSDELAARRKTKTKTKTKTTKTKTTK